MKLAAFSAICFLIAAGISSPASGNSQKDTVKTSEDNLTITFIGHGSLIFQYGGKTIHVDPFGKLADYSSFPKADLILITHDHFDHLDADAIMEVSTDSTKVVLNEAAAARLGRGLILANGDKKNIMGFSIEAVPAYNLVHMRSEGVPFHPKGNGNGYIITFGDRRVYIAGDTENVPEMKALKNIDIAFLPMNLPYTMTPEMVADAAKAFRPGILYPYHFGETDTSKVIELLKGSRDIEVRIRDMK
ncbi:MAG: MBL fold metallo-hydrolase [bacterium]